MSIALEYNVEPDGRVTTNGAYREITRAQWDALPQPVSGSRSVYDAAARHVQRGAIVAFPCRDAKHAWHVTRTLGRTAQRLGVAVEIKRAPDPDNPPRYLACMRRSVED